MRTEEIPAGALLVGSVPLEDTDAVIATAARCLGRHLRRIPDGETGVRTIWVTWQQSVFAGHPDLVEEAKDEDQYAPFPRYRIRDGVDPAGHPRPDRRRTRVRGEFWRRDRMWLRPAPGRVGHPFTAPARGRRGAGGVNAGVAFGSPYRVVHASRPLDLAG
jgi:hypothetical protein